MPITYIKARIRSFGHAFKGIATFFLSTPHAKIHALAIVAITALGLWLGLAAWEWCVMVVCMGMVVTLEAINSAIEFTVDLITSETHPLAKNAKDVAAGAVLLGVIFCGIAWGIIFLPKLIQLIS
ncbi:diacylglycerol kinase family protein [Pontibacter sp. G13]|uniref:diacylglycerol kinase n=1 Tax=Pontibacter sp. G13 TaxID=3074898 RepID=UPI00288B086D|nr:diacylglycerol kinase family protein [Pontibacter sp. G13]WNJ16329.1 diacylglycerol kinase family protein [Pontibacter sp. G13]